MSDTYDTEDKVEVLAPDEPPTPLWLPLLGAALLLLAAIFYVASADPADASSPSNPSAKPTAEPVE